MLGTSVLKLLTVANLCYQLVYFTKLPCYTRVLIQHPSFLGNLPPLSILITCLLNNVCLGYYWEKLNVDHY